LNHGLVSYTTRLTPRSVAPAMRDCASLTVDRRRQPHSTPIEIRSRPRSVLGSVVVRFNGVKVFSATMFADRGQLGDKVTAWIASNSQRKLTDIVVTQSSDAAFHCITISVFYHETLR
jgi:hypothetical protein